MANSFQIWQQFSTPSTPSYKLVRTKECDEAFIAAKSQLTSGKVLTHYDSTLPLSLAAGASAYEIGAVISHTFPDCTERPIALALNPNLK